MTGNPHEEGEQAPKGRLRIGGIILCGGNSKRMGLPKATLPLGPELMLQRIVRLLSEVVNPVVVVAAAGQALPQLSQDIIVAHDELDSSGPLEGLRIGLRSIARHADAAYCTSCDVPLLSASFVSHVIARLGDNDAAVPVDDDFHYPLAAVYRTGALDAVEAQLRNKVLKMSWLFDSVKTTRIPLQELQQVDSELLSLMNVNTPSDYIQALSRCGYVPEPSITSQLEL